MSDGAIRLRIDLAYDGTDLAGWARQPGQRTVQGELEDALTILFGSNQKLLTVGAGRTDAGVHARGQVAHVDVPESLWSLALSRADGGSMIRLAESLRALLPGQVNVKSLNVVPPSFDARFSALWRRYRYHVCDDVAAFDPLERGWVVAWPRQLRVETMSELGQHLIGERDMAVFCKKRPDSSTVRRLHSLRIWREQAHVTFEFVAQSFCHSMVRSVVGALLAVGDDRRPEGWFHALLAKAERDPQIHVAPAHGLVLEEVGYSPSGNIGASN